jgi:hypothetical protein
MFYDLLSKERKRLMRTVDVVLCHKMGGPGTNTELGASIPIRLYAVSPGIEEGDYLVDQKNQYTMESEAGLDRGSR